MHTNGAFETCIFDVTMQRMWCCCCFVPDAAAPDAVNQVLEKGVTERCGSFVNQHVIQLLRLPMSATPRARTPTYKLVVLPR